MDGVVVFVKKLLLRFQTLKECARNEYGKKE